MVSPRTRIVRRHPVVINRKLLALAWIEIDDEVPAAVALVRGTLLPSWKAQHCILQNLMALRWYERVTRHYHLRCPERGEHRFGPVELRSGDLFGLARRRLELPARQTLLVYPKVVAIEALGLARAVRAWERLDHALRAPVNDSQPDAHNEKNGKESRS